MLQNKKYGTLIVSLIGSLFLATVVMMLLVLAAPRCEPAPGITKESFFRLHHGMKVEEVDALFGTSGEWYDCCPGSYMSRRWIGEDKRVARVGFQTVPPAFQLGAVDGYFVEADGSRIEVRLQEPAKPFWQRVRGFLPW